MNFLALSLLDDDGTHIPVTGSGEYHPIAEFHRKEGLWDFWKSFLGVCSS
jgi:hypothetical protein